MWANLKHLTEVIVDECAEINRLFRNYEYCSLSHLSHLLSRKQDSKTPFSGHRVKLPL